MRRKSGHLVLLNYASDFRGAALRLGEGGIETYFGQRYSVGAIGALLERYGAVTVVDWKSNTAHDERLPMGVRSIGLGQDAPTKGREVGRILHELSATDLVISHPLPSILYWSIRSKAELCVVSANGWTPQRGLKGWFQSKRLAFLLNHRRIRWVAAYGMAAALSFQRIGVKPEKIVPWDFLAEKEPESFSPLKHPQKASIHLVYIGQLTRAKGVEDAIDAVAVLRAQGLDVDLTLIGQDAEGRMADLVARKGLGSSVHFAGIIAAGEIEPFLRTFGAILVPSRHDYPEGFPLVLVHAMRARIPIIASDHPMFSEVLRHQDSAMLFPAGDAAALAQAVQTLFANPDLYEALSDRSHTSLNAVRVPLKYHDILDSAFASDGPGFTLLSSHSLLAKPVNG